MYTTIKISKLSRKSLDRMKFRPSETYEDVIGELLEDHLALNPQFAKELGESHAQSLRGERISFGEVRKRIGLHGQN